MMKPKRSIYLLCIALSALTGCTSTDLDDDDRAATKTVSVNKKPSTLQVGNVVYATTATKAVTSAGAFMGGLPGAIMIAAARGATKDEREQFLDILRQNRIDFGVIVAEQLEKRMRLNGMFKVGYPADAQFEFDIKAAGLTSSEGGMRPVIFVIGKLTNREGKIIWRDKLNVEKPTPMALPGNLETWRANPNSLRESIKAVADQLSDEWIKSLNDD
jgi:hypothetical protein